MGKLSIADNMKVYAGNDGTNYERDGKPFTAGERVSAANYRTNARIEVCDHPDKTYEIGNSGHMQICEYCTDTSEFLFEEHIFADVPGTAVTATCIKRGREADKKCTVCGYIREGAELDFGPHDWSDWSDNGDGYLIRTCNLCDETEKTPIEPDPTCEHTNKTTIAKLEPTCTERGREEYYQCEECESYFVKENDEYIILTPENMDTYMEKLTIPALGHDWQEPSYRWQESGGDEHAAMYGIIICNRETSHIVEETTENITKEVTKEPTCEDKGETTYTANFTNEALTPQTDTVADINPLGHEWGEATYSWKLNEGSETEGTCTAHRNLLLYIIYLIELFSYL